MTVWHVVVEAWDKDGNGNYFDSVVLAHSERGARSSATRAAARVGLTGAHSVEAIQLDHRETGVIFTSKRAVMQQPTRKELPT